MPEFGDEPGHHREHRPGAVGGKGSRGAQHPPPARCVHNEYAGSWFSTDHEPAPGAGARSLVDTIRFLMLPVAWTAVHHRRSASNPNSATASRDVGMHGARSGGHAGPRWTRRTVLEWAIALDLRNDNPCATTATSSYWSMFNSVDAAIGPPLRIGNASRLPSPSVCAASRTSTARPRSGTRRRAHLHPLGRHGPHPPGQLDLVPRRRPELADRTAVVVAPGHGGAVPARRHVVVVDAAAVFGPRATKACRGLRSDTRATTACRRRPPTSTPAPATTAPRDSVSQRASSPCSPSLPARKNGP